MKKLSDFYKPEKAQTFDDTFKKITRRDRVLASRIKRKVKDICEYPERGEPLSGNLVGKWSIRVAAH